MRVVLVSLDTLVKKNRWGNNTERGAWCGGGRGGSGRVKDGGGVRKRSRNVDILD